MKRALICSVLALGIASTTAEAAKPKKQESEVQKALKERYPDAQTEITNTTDVNGVKVYDVKVTTKQGSSNAQITDTGDFLMYGSPHEYGAIRSAIQQDVSGLFQAKPEDIEMYRVTNYFVEFKGPKGKNYTATFDAVGRLQDIATSEQMKLASGETSRGDRVKDEASVKKLATFAQREIPGAEVEAVYKGAAGQGDFMTVALKGGGEVVVNEQGQVLSLRHPIPNEELPEAVAATIKTIFTAPIASLSRGETEYYQFTQQSQRGAPIVVQMRPNGDILQVRNMEAIQDEQAQQAKSKSQGSKAKPTATEKKG